MPGVGVNIFVLKSDWAKRKWLGILLPCGVFLCFLVPFTHAQDVPAIRVEAREVLVPVRVFSSRGYEVPHLDASDFHLFEDDQEQQIQNVISVLVYDRMFNDNRGVGDEWARTPRGKWTSFHDTVRSIASPAYVHLIAYVPPPSKPGSCHQIKVKLDPNGTSGGSLVFAQVQFGQKITKEQVERRTLLVRFRTEYCNTEHSSYDPLNGTKANKLLEGYAAATDAKTDGLSLQASAFYQEPGPARIQIGLDFSSIGGQTGIPSFNISLLGMIYKKDGTLAVRFSDSTQAGCLFTVRRPTLATYQLCKEGIPNHYETQVNLPPGDYDVRVVLDYGGQLRRAQVPITVDKLDGKQLALSGIALCKRFHKRSEPEQTPVSTMLFEFLPLLSAGMEFTLAGDTHFKKWEPLIVYFEAYEPLLAGTGTANVQFEVKIVDPKTGEARGGTGLLGAQPWVRAGNPVIPIAEKISIDKLPPNTYRLEVQVSDSAGNRSGWRATSFTLD